MDTVFNNRDDFFGKKSIATTSTEPNSLFDELEYKRVLDETKKILKQRGKEIGD